MFRLRLLISLYAAGWCCSAGQFVPFACSDESSKSLSDELPRIPAVEPAETLSTFEVTGGFSLELVAAEPHVSDPVDACFDESGRMYVAEMHGYPFSQEPTRLNPKGGGKPDAGIVRLLEDTDGDGKMDRSVKFADGIRWPTSVCCYKGGVFVLAPPALWYFRDTDNDGIADERRVIYEGFDRGNVQSVANNLKWGLDHRIYGAGGRNPSVLKRDGKEVLKLGRTDFSFNPDTLEVRAETGGVQYGHSFDDWGNRFVCSNSNHIQQVVFPYEALNRNPAFQVRSPIRSIAAGGAAAPVFRRSPAEPWRIVRTRRRVADPRYARLPATERVPIGFFTSATGVTIYRGDAWPEKYRGQAFIGDVGGNLIHRKTLNCDSDQVVFVAKRADDGREFIASTDNWFRPVNFVNAPDGTLYVLDMYRETIEHPYSIPEDIKEHLDLEGGADRGRIYRIVGPDGKRKPVERLGDLTTIELVRRLDSRNAWVRETAQRLILERDDDEAVPGLRTLLKQSNEPLGRVSTLWCLSGLGALSNDDVLRALNDTHPRVREQGVVLTGDFSGGTETVSDRLAELSSDQDQRVRFQLALAVANAKTARRDVLRAILSQSDSNTHVRTAAMTSVGDDLPDLLNEILTDRRTKRRLKPSDGYTGEFRAWLIEAVRSVAAMKDESALPVIFPEIVQRERPDGLRVDLLLAVNSGLRQRGTSLQSWLQSESREGLKRDMEIIVDLHTRSIARRDLTDAERMIWIPILSLTDEATAERHLPELLTPRESQKIQLAAVEAIANHPSDGVSAVLLRHWSGLSPGVRKPATAAMTRSVQRAEKFLSALEGGFVKSAEIAPETRQLLLGHPNSRIKQMATRLLGADVNSDRAKIVKQYEVALELEPDLVAGRAVFMKKCSVCHRVEKTGHAVGPDIVSVLNKSPSDLLISIMDPNREAQPNFTAYSVVTEAGQVYNGLIAGESASAITLKRAEGKQDTIARSEIEQLVSSGRTLMPDGLEKELKPQDIANVIGFIKSLNQQPEQQKPD